MEGGYVEVVVAATDETAEGLADFLFTEGALGLVTEESPKGPAPITIRASFTAPPPIGPILERLKRYQQALKALGFDGTEGRVEVHELPVEDWGRSWKEHFTPFPVRRRLIIAPSWSERPVPDGYHLIRIDPGMSFGTGHHATTRMCLEALEAFMEEWPGGRGPEVLDVGTGTGILAIAAATLGAGRVVAIDTDPQACEAAMRNLALNEAADRVQLLHGGVELLGPAMRFDLILANLDGKNLRGICDTLPTLLTPGGRVICSGVLVEEEAGVTAAMRAARLQVVARGCEGEWLSLTLALDPALGNRAMPHHSEGF